MLLDKLERKFGRYAVENITLYLIVTQVLIFALGQFYKFLIPSLMFFPHLILQGEVWRLLGFLIIPPGGHPIFIFFAWYLFYLMGNSLEANWGTFRYNMFLLVGTLATIGVAFLTMAPASNAYLAGSVFLAFAFLNPDYQLLLFFVLPLKVKWLALLAWLSYGYRLVVEPLPVKLTVLAAIINFILFFYNDIKTSIKYGRKQVGRNFKARAKDDRDLVHKCLVCGITDRDDKKMDFRYCTDCAGKAGYCRTHINGHECVTSPK